MMLLDAASIILTAVISLTAVAYFYFEIRNTYRKINRERFFERIKEKMEEDSPHLHQRLIANLTDYPAISGRIPGIRSELYSTSDSEKREMIVHSQLLKDLEKFYIYASIDEGEFYKLTNALKEKIIYMKIDIAQRQNLVQFLERWYSNQISERAAFFEQFYPRRAQGSERRLLFTVKRKLVEERGEDFIRRQRARIFENFRSIIQMTS